MEDYKRCVMKHLGKHVLKHSKDVLFSLKCVDNDLKPAFLFDSACISVHKMTKFIDELHSLALIETSLNVLVVEDDLFIYKYDALLRYLHNTRDALEKGEGPLILDASPGLTNPEIKDDTATLVTIISSVIEYLGSRENKESDDNTEPGPGASIVSYSLNLPVHINRTTVYGLLLGYPIIYWYKTVDNPEGNNCLDYVPLCVHNVLTKLELHSSEKLSFKGSVYKFSYPHELSHRVLKSVEVWFHKLHHTSSYELDMNSDVQTIPSVAM